MTRKAVREALGIIFTNIGFNTVNLFAPKDLQGQTKVLNVYSKRSRLEKLSADMKNDFYTFNLDVLVKRTGVVADEDDLDTLHDALKTAVSNNIGNAAWSHLEMNEDSDAMFVEISGVPYRMERHTLKVKLSS